jgi:hypothetical protein
MSDMRTAVCGPRDVQEPLQPDDWGGRMIVIAQCAGGQ